MLALINAEFTCSRCQEKKPIGDLVDGWICADCRRCKARARSFVRAAEVKRWMQGHKETPAHKLVIRRSNRSVSARLAACRQAAAKRDLECALRIDEYALLIIQPCAYCGGPLNETGSGLDRKDSAKGYTIENVVPCCRDCNSAKSNRFTYEEMLIIGAAIRRVKDDRAWLR